jgi:exodeoxyribonuclease VII large subunit
MQRPEVRVVGVRRLSEYLKLKFEKDPNLAQVAVRGEVTNHGVMPRGHVSFELKEGDVSLAAFVWQSDAMNLPVLRNGLSIVAYGSVRTYPGRSRYQIYVTGVELAGIGDVHAQFEERKKRLTTEGLFAPERKRPLPAFPFSVALVSSRKSDGAIDFVSILRDRAPHVRVVWCETPVQGPAAAPDICRAIDRASRLDVDAIVVTRGGGSFEDLFVFSDEEVVRAIARAKHPVISAIGHTADQQLCDFVADRHFETPSAAAKGLGFDRDTLLERLDESIARAERSIELAIERRHGRLASALLRSKLGDTRLLFAPLAQRVSDAESTVDAAVARRLRSLDVRVRDLGKRLDPYDPTRMLADRGRRLEAARGRLSAATRTRVELSDRRLAEIRARLLPASRTLTGRAVQQLAMARRQLESNDPEAILQRGYAIVTYDDAIVRDPATLPPGARIAARLARGTVVARVESEGTNGN